MRMARVLAVVLSLAGCAVPQQHEMLNRVPGAVAFASVGDVMVRVNVKEDLPNAFGGADIFGRQRDRGFSELRFMGLAPDGLAIFRRRDVDIITDEDTMSRSGFKTAVVSTQPSGQGVITTGISAAPQAAVEVLPPDTTEFALDLSRGHVVTLRNKSVEVVKADSNGISFIVHE